MAVTLCTARSPLLQRASTVAQLEHGLAGTATLNIAPMLFGGYFDDISILVGGGGEPIGATMPKVLLRGRQLCSSLLAATENAWPESMYVDFEPDVLAPLTRQPFHVSLSLVMANHFSLRCFPPFTDLKAESMTSRSVEYNEL